MSVVRKTLSARWAISAHKASRAVLRAQIRPPTTPNVGALGAISLSALALVHDLGRPGRFANMLRVFKPSSPMSVGSWLLAGYGPVAGAAAVSEVTGILPKAETAATLGAGLLGPAIATYTAALLCDTAVPAWHAGYREMPYVFAGSAASASLVAASAMTRFGIFEAGMASARDPKYTIVPQRRRPG